MHVQEVNVDNETNINLNNKITNSVKWEPYTCVQSVVEIDKYLIKYCETTGQNCTGDMTYVIKT